MNQAEWNERVKGVLAAEWNVPIGDIPDDAALNRFPPWDSLGHITIMLALSEAFGFELNADIVQEMLSLRQIVEHLQEHVNGSDGNHNERACLGIA